MRSSKRSKPREVRDFAQLGLDFTPPSDYSDVPRKENEAMNQELFETLETKVSNLLDKYSALKDENSRLAEENQRLLSEREGLKARVDAILGKLEGI
jgi:cell division protein ZapB